MPVDNVDCCVDCGGILVDMYKSNVRVSTSAQICMGCHCLWMDGEKTLLPQDWKKKYPTVASRAKEASEKILAQAKEDPDFKAKKYFERVFTWAFSEGFIRAYAIFRHTFKEGRYKRIRELWRKTSMEVYGNKAVIEGLDREEIEELSRLIIFERKSQKGQLFRQDLSMPKLD